MDPALFQRIRAIYLEAGEREGEARLRYLAEACGEDRDLRREVERLLHAETIPTGHVVPPPEPVAPPRSCGLFRIEREIGRGGMGAVYAATAPDGTPVAIKVIHPHLASLPRLRERFRREAELGREVVHENVVRTLGFGEEEGRLFIVMERVEGRTLRTLLGELGTIPERLLREIALKVARALEAIHARGIVHRDVKPENILVNDAAQVRLMDLGVARPQDAPSLTATGQFLGSLHYAAPEQCHGEEVGPAADLYALGIVLYELATGENPFARKSLGAVIVAQMEFRPPAADERNPELTPFLGALVGTLLEKDPAARFADAASLAAVLAEGERSPWWRERQSLAARPRVDVRREAPLVGREPELAGLRADFHRMRAPLPRRPEEAEGEAPAGNGGAILIESEPGLGKTRLIDGFLASLPERETHLLYGSFAGAGGMRGFREAVVEKFGEARLEPSLRPYLERRALLAPFAAFLRGDAATRAFEKESLAAAFTDLLRGLARERPTVLVLEDLEFASAEARAVALQLARAASRFRALVILSASPGLAPAERAAYLRGENAHLVALSRLGPDDVRAMLDTLLGDPGLVEELAEEVATKSDGIPFFVIELVRGLAERGVIAPRPGGGYVRRGPLGVLEIPSSLRDLLRARLRELAPESRSLLEIAAVEGFEFEPDRIAAAAGLPLVGALRQFAEIERRSRLVRGHGRDLRFDNHPLREVIYEDLSEPLRAALHTALAEAQARRPAGADPGRDAHYVVKHHLRGRTPAEALPRLDAALDFLRARGRHDEEATLLDEALRAPDLLAGAGRLERLLRQADRLHFLSRSEAERAVVGEAEELARTIGDPRLEARTRIALGNLLWSANDDAETTRAYGEALDLARAAGDRKVEARALALSGTIAMRAKRLEEAEERLAEACRIAEAIGDAEIDAMASGHLGLVHETRGDHDRALPLLERWQARGRASGARRVESFASINLSLLLSQTGRFEEAEAQGRHGLAISEEIGDGRGEAYALNCLGLVALDVGRVELACARLRRNLDIARDLRDVRLELDAAIDLAAAERRLGQFPAALARCARAAETAARIGAPELKGRADLLRSSIALDLGDAGNARRFGADGVAALASSGDVALRALSLLTLAAALDACGEEAAALAAARDALAAAESARAPRLRFPALCRLAAHDPGSAGAALEAIGRLEPLTPLFARLEGRILLFRATGDPAHREEARRLLRSSLDSVESEPASAVVERVPAYHALLAG